MDREEWSVYTLLRDGVPVEYEYGPSWKAVKLRLDGGYPSAEEAKRAWLAEYEAKHGGQRA